MITFLILFLILLSLAINEDLRNKRKPYIGFILWILCFIGIQESIELLVVRERFLGYTEGSYNVLNQLKMK